MQSDVAFFPVVAPVATYPGQPDLSETLVGALRREDQRANRPAMSGTLAGLPSSHASILIYAGKDRFSPTHRHVGLMVPPSSFTGMVDMLGEIDATGAADPRTGTPQNNFRYSVSVSALPWQADFMLDPGSYVCHLIVRERASHRVYGESVSFEVQ